MVTDLKEDIFNLEELSNDGLGEMPDPFFQDEPENAFDGRKYVVFQLGIEYFGINSERVAEVVRMLSLTEIPNVPDWFLGIANLRGDIISVVDLNSFWGNQHTDNHPKEKLIVLRSENSETNLAVRVDRLREIVSIPDDSLAALESPRPHLFATAVHKDLQIKIIDPTSLLSSLTLR